MTLEDDARRLPLGQLLARYGWRRILLFAGYLIVLGGLCFTLITAYEEYLHARFGPGSLARVLVNSGLLVALALYQRLSSGDKDK